MIPAIVSNSLLGLGRCLLSFWLWVECYLLTKVFPDQVKSTLRRLYGLDKENLNLATVHSPLFYSLTATKGMLGLAQSYAKGYISIQDIPKFVENVVVHGNIFEEWIFRYKAFLEYLEFDLFCKYNPKDDHYTLIGNELWEKLLDSGMNYSNGLWLDREKDTLETAQRHKMELLAQKMKLKPGMEVLEIGCGWGGMAAYLAKEYGVSVVAITDCPDGAAYARKLCTGLPVKVICGDGRDVIKGFGENKFDRVLVIEVLEHVGRRNYATFFRSLATCLKKKDGLMVIQSFGISDPAVPSVNSLPNTVVPGTMIPYIGDFVTALAGIFVVEHWSNSGPSYEHTMMAFSSRVKKDESIWIERLGKEWVKVYQFFLQTTATMAKLRKIQSWQIVLSKGGLNGGGDYHFN